MKRIVALILAVMLLTLAGCGSGEDITSVKADLQAKEAQVQELQTKLADQEKKTGEQEAKNAELTDKLSKLESTFCVTALHATIDGKTSVTANGETKVTAQAVLSDGKVVDHWELNGEVQADATGDTFSFTAKENAVVEAVLRDEKKVTTVNCNISFLDEDGYADGDTYKEFVFEKPYKNPVTQEEITDGTFTARIEAEVPYGYELDYWKINGVEYHPSYESNSFVVKGLDEATEYEAVLKERPITYYVVTCRYCTVYGQREAYVEAGSYVTAVGDPGFSYEVYINGTEVDSYVKEYTFEVTGDTEVVFYAIIN